MNFNDIPNLIKDVGFPIVVTFYLLLRVEKQLNILSNEIISLNDYIRNEIHTQNNIESQEENNIKLK